jgi:hypothetical protein
MGQSETRSEEKWSKPVWGVHAGNREGGLMGWVESGGMMYTPGILRATLSLWAEENWRAFLAGNPQP